MKRNEEIIDAVDHFAEKSLKFLQELVKTPSLEGDEKNCQLIINEKFHSMGLTWNPERLKIDHLWHQIFNPFISVHSTRNRSKSKVFSY